MPANLATPTCKAEQSGLAAVFKPLITSEVLAIGMQVIGPQGNDFQLLRLTPRWQQEASYLFAASQAVKEFVYH
tara:strand:- start:253 stop:474 length:222 start_codon:yes stop_codon:yes gene_type:complete